MSKDSSDTLTIRVTDGINNEMKFRIKPNTKMEKVMMAFCKKNGLTMDSVRFMVDGTRLQKADTPKMLELEDGDMIQAMVEQVGGF